MGYFFCRIGGVLLSAAILFFVTACGAKGSLSMSSYEKPDAVDNLRAVHREKSLTLFWSYAGGEKYFISGFVVERADAGQPFRRLAVVSADATNYVDESFIPGAVYHYRVLALSRKDRLSDVATPIRVEPKPLPAAPTGLEAKATAEGVELRWKSVGAGMRYNVYKSTVRGTCGEVLAAAQPTDTPVFRESANPTSTVYYCVRALYSTDVLDEGFPSEEYAVAPSLYIPGRVVELRGIATEQGVQLIWGERSEYWVKTYRVYRKLNNQKEFLVIGETTIPAFLDRVPDSASAAYAVEAVGPVQAGQRSASVVVHPYREP
ncbi:MAG TPA: fibronectin type III domain-containing protein [Dissulfurispiraceae bacterium]|nr:fibronectin type III domain-containing protein [Dissulfurispiraceae bacterium]